MSDDRVIDFNDLKNKVKDSDVDKFEQYIYNLYFSVMDGSMTMAEFSRKIFDYMKDNNISQEKFMNIQKKFMERYGMDSEEVERQLKNFGIKNEEVIDCVGANAKMNEFQAAMGICNLKNIDVEIEKRKAVVEQYRKRLSGIDGIKICEEQEGVKQNYSYFPIVVDSSKFGANRDEICEKLKENNIFARKYFYPITNSFDCFNGKYDVNETPVALKISKRVLTLPLYSDLSLDSVDRICDVILSLKK